jgi:diketogulonate reductase-like aldo/keto reductase
MNYAPARRVGTALACPLTGRISKGRAKGDYEIIVLILGVKAIDQNEAYERWWNTYRRQGMEMVRILNISRDDVFIITSSIKANDAYIP